MAITYPISLPSNKIMRVTFHTDSVVSISENPFTLERKKFAHSGQRWRIEITTTEMKPEDAEAFIAALVSLNGPEGTFHIGDPLRTSPRGNVDGSLLVDGASQTGNTLDVKSASTGGDGDPLFYAGDWIEIGTGSSRRLYKVMQDVNIGAGSTATLDIWPRLRESPSDGDSITYTNTKGTFELEENFSWPWKLPDFTSFTFTAIEAI